MKKILRTNSKLKKDNIYSFGIPPLKSITGLVICSKAKDCAKGCYARHGFYRTTSSKSFREQNLALSLTNEFIPTINAEIARLLKRINNLHIRIHDSGDFFSEEYLLNWLAIMNHNPKVIFYAYTKEVSLLKKFQRYLPNNFVVIYSFGGKEDNLIDINTDRYSKVFNTEIPKELANASVSDLVALGPNKKIGLIYHGTLNYSNTGWSRS